jgi:hypothetical protein
MEYREEYGCSVVRQPVARYSVDVGVEDPTSVIEPKLLQEIEHNVSNSIPFIITGTVSNWPAFSKWQDPEYLLQKVLSNSCY